MANYITTTELTAYAPEMDLSGYSSPTLSGIIARASAQVDNICDVDGFDFVAVTDETSRSIITSYGELVIPVKRPPVSNVTDITLKKGTYTTSLILTDSGETVYEIPDGGRRIHYPDSFLDTTGTLVAGANGRILSLKGSNVFCKVSYQGGYQNIPEAIKQATTLLVRDIVSARNNQDGLSGFSQGSYSVNYATDSSGKSKLYKEAEALLQGYKIRAL